MEDQKHIVLDIVTRLEVVNMCAEDFDDAMFFMSESKNTDDPFEKRRYIRAAIVFFCATAESWARDKIIRCLENKLDRTEDEENLYNKLAKSTDGIAYLKIDDLIKKWLPKLVLNAELNDEQEAIINKFKELANLRNNFIHYSDRNFEEQYNIERLEEILSDVPQSIGKLINVFESIEEVTWYINTMDKYGIKIPD